jgi:CBS-domain-containing membrane protein
MKKLYEVLGITQTPVSHAEKIVSAVGGFVAIFCIYYISQLLVGPVAGVIIVASMGASAVLLFAVPHGQLSQPWPVIGGHLLSAVIGVSCAKLIPHAVLAASLAVGSSIAVMYYLRCVHPPGGATAISAVIGGDAVHELGYQFVLTPILLNVIIVLFVAVTFNYLFRWRRYPVFLRDRQLSKQVPPSSSSASSQIDHEDFVYALSEIDSFIDINEHDLLRIYDIVTRKTQTHVFTPDKIVVDGYYSNGKYGEDWSVRHIVDESPGKNGDEDIVVYKVVAGQGRRSSGYSSRSDFLRWAKHQVVRDEENWKRLDDTQ